MSDGYKSGQQLIRNVGFVLLLIFGCVLIVGYIILVLLGIVLAIFR